MKKELDYFTIDEAFGGNQEWFTNVVMNIGGCGAATACDSCIYFARYKGMKEWYPFDEEHLTKEEYKAFSQIMKPYIRPRVGGVKKLEWYIDGLNRYIRDVNEQKGVNTQITMEAFSGNYTCKDAGDKIRSQIDSGYPVPYLMLKHKDTQKFQDFIWHWFLVVGYEELKNDMQITVATYGEATEFSLKELWDTGYEEKGGMILYSGLEKTELKI